MFAASFSHIIHSNYRERQERPTQAISLRLISVRHYWGRLLIETLYIAIVAGTTSLSKRSWGQWSYQEGYTGDHPFVYLCWYSATVCCFPWWTLPRHTTLMAVMCQQENFIAEKRKAVQPTIVPAGVEKLTCKMIVHMFLMEPSCHSSIT